MSGDIVWNLLTEYERNIYGDKKNFNDEILSKIRFVLNNNSIENREIVNATKYFLAQLYSKFYDFDALRKAFALPDDKIYYKKQEIVKVLPFNHFNEHFISKLNDILYNENTKTRYTKCNNLLKKYLRLDEYSDVFDNIDKFILANPYMAFIKRKTYEDIDSEYYKIAKILKKYKDIKKAEYDKSNLCGKLGELLYWNHLYPQNNSEFVSRDIGDGLGYDNYCQTPNKEILIEVKSTLNLNGDDIFKVTDNEFKILKEAVNNNASYFISRVFISIDEPFYDYLLLTFDEERNMFFDINNAIAYKYIGYDKGFVYQNLDNKYVMKRRNLLKKTM